MVAYRQDAYAYVGRVVQSTAMSVTVNRNNRPDESMLRSMVIGKVISVYWRGAPTAEAASTPEDKSAAITAVKAYTGDIDVWLYLVGRVAPASDEKTSQTPDESLDAALKTQLRADYVRAAQQLAEKQAKVEELKPVLKPEHFRMQNLQSDIQQLQLQIETIKKRYGEASPGSAEPIEADLKATKSVTVLFQIPEADVSKVVKKLRQGEHAPVQAYDQTGQKLLGSGQLVGVDQQIDPSTGTLACQAEVTPEPEALLYPNQFLNIHVMIEKKTGVTLLPMSALQFSSTSPSVFVHVIDSAGYISLRRVTVGAPNGQGMREITDGLVPGEIVVANANEQVKEGDKVRYNLVAPGKPPGPAPQTRAPMIGEISPSSINGSSALPGIYLAAIITMAVAVAVFGTLICKVRQPADARLLWLAALIVLPLQPLAFYCVRIPFDHWVVAHLGAKSVAYFWLRTFYAPLTEGTGQARSAAHPRHSPRYPAGEFCPLCARDRLGFRHWRNGIRRGARGPHAAICPSAFLPIWRLLQRAFDDLRLSQRICVPVALAIAAEILFGFFAEARRRPIWLGNFPLVSSWTRTSVTSAKSPVWRSSKAGCGSTFFWPSLCSVGFAWADSTRQRSSSVAGTARSAGTTTTRRFSP